MSDKPGGTARQGDGRGQLGLAVGALVVAAGLAAVLVPWDWVPGGELAPMSVGELFSAAEVERAESFAAERRLWAWSAYGVSLLTLGVLGFTPLGARLVRRLGGRRWWTTVVIGTLAVLVIDRLVRLPFALLIRNMNLEAGLTRQGLPGWIRDLLVALAVSWVVTSLLLLTLVGLARRAGRRWYAWAGALAAAFVVAGSFAYPLVVEPLFNRFEPLEDQSLRARVVELGQVQGVDVGEVLVADASRRTTTLNAYVSGLGATRRVVLYDTLLEKTPREEVEVVVAHELAHARHRDVAVSTAIGAVAAAGGVAALAWVLGSGWARRRVGVAGAGDPAAVALVLALAAVAGFASSPVVNAISRAVEVRADRDSLAATGADDAFIGIQRRLALESLADPTPPVWSQVWFGSHPTVLQRAGLPSSLQRVGR